MSIEQESSEQQEGMALRAESNKESVQIEESLKPLQPFLSLPLEVSVELGRGRIALRELLDLKYHSIFELDKMAGDNLDILANGVLLGTGEVMITDERTSIKINEITDTPE